MQVVLWGHLRNLKADFTIHFTILDFIVVAKAAMANGPLSTDAVPNEDRYKYKYFFRDSTELNIEDFDSTYFVPGWDQCYRQYKGVATTLYTGCRIRFPLTVTLYLDWTKPERFYKDSNGTVVKKKCIFVEMVKINLNKEDC